MSVTRIDLSPLPVLLRLVDYDDKCCPPCGTSTRADSLDDSRTIVVKNERELHIEGEGVWCFPLFSCCFKQETSRGREVFFTYLTQHFKHFACFLAPLLEHVDLEKNAALTVGEVNKVQNRAAALERYEPKFIAQKKLLRFTLIYLKTDPKIAYKADIPSPIQTFDRQKVITKLGTLPLHRLSMLTEAEKAEIADSIAKELQGDFDENMILHHIACALKMRKMLLNICFYVKIMPSSSIQRALMSSSTIGDDTTLELYNTFKSSMPQSTP